VAEQQPLMTSSAECNRKFEPTYFRWNAAAIQRAAAGSRRTSVNVAGSRAVLHVQTADELDEQVRYKVVMSSLTNRCVSTWTLH